MHDREKALRVAFMQFIDEVGKALNRPITVVTIDRVFKDTLPPAQDPPDFYRAEGGCLCPDCGIEYRRHPHAPELGFVGDPSPLRLLCDGTRVKL